MISKTFFDDFPSITYSLDDGKSIQVVTDILRRVILSKEFKTNTSFFEQYEVFQGETPEDVSYRFYGTQRLHWLVLMVNDIINPRFEWPLTGEQMFRQVEKIYGEKASVYSLNRAKDRKGYVVETYFLLTEDSTHKNQVRLCYETTEENETKEPIAWAESDIISDFETNYEVEVIENETYRTLKILKAEVVSDVIREYKKLIAL
jgi:hypothetical protein